MSPERPRRSTRELRASYDETLDAVHRRFEQLESAVAQFSPDLDETASPISVRRPNSSWTPHHASSAASRAG